VVSSAQYAIAGPGVELKAHPGAAAPPPQPRDEK